MKFKYTARAQEGDLQAGFVEAVNREAAANILTGHNLFVLNLEEVEKTDRFGDILSFLNRVKLKDLMIFTRQFATLMESKVPLSNSLKALQQQTKNLVLKEAVLSIYSDINSGLSLSQSMERQGKIFSEFYINMIRSAEITGSLGEAMSFLADYLEKEQVWRSRIINALIYPATVIVLFFGVAILMLTIVLPQLTPIFEETGADLPLFTKVFLTGGDFILEWWFAIILISVILIYSLIAYFQSREGKIVANELVIKIPIFGNLFKKIYVARFAESTSILIKGGIPITQALEISSHAIGNIVYRDILREVAESVRGGELLSALLSQNEYYFPSLVGQMVAIGESTGRLDELLSRISSFYTREIDDTLNNLTELVQPILMAAIGVFIGLLFASILIPIYNLIQQF